MRASEAAESAGVSVKALRYYEASRLDPLGNPPQNSCSTCRVGTDDPATSSLAARHDPKPVTRQALSCFNGPSQVTTRE